MSNTQKRPVHYQAIHTEQPKKNASPLFHEEVDLYIYRPICLANRSQNQKITQLRHKTLTAQVPWTRVVCKVGLGVFCRKLDFGCLSHVLQSGYCSSTKKRRSQAWLANKRATQLDNCVGAASWLANEALFSRCHVRRSSTRACHYKRKLRKNKYIVRTNLTLHGLLCLFCTLCLFSCSSSYRNSFDCPPHRGLPAASVTEVEARIIEMPEGEDIFVSASVSGPRHRSRRHTGTICSGPTDLYRVWVVDSVDECGRICGHYIYFQGEGS